MFMTQTYLQDANRDASVFAEAVYFILFSLKPLIVNTCREKQLMVIECMPFGECRL